MARESPESELALYETREGRLKIKRGLTKRALNGKPSLI